LLDVVDPVAILSSLDLVLGQLQGLWLALDLGDVLAIEEVFLVLCDQRSSLLVLTSLEFPGDDVGVLGELRLALLAAMVASFVLRASLVHQRWSQLGVLPRLCALNLLLLVTCVVVYVIYVSTY
jgi:hypothetical protein